ncbi:T9SS type A sorting domain-containing protein [candidate division KSB1 bacterium]|nr:T9SS type A sorting domain-containing protein [candidate division KSB1 bacterium]
MKMCYKVTPVLFVAMFLLMGRNGIGAPLNVYVQDDTVRAPEVLVVPTINGIGDDPCWGQIDWQTIDQTWIPWGGDYAADDFSGRYKVVWSSTENLLYFLVEVVDDIAVGGYRIGQTADIYHFDMVEVFIDEDKSGGLHVFDGQGRDAQSWGTNAENAFAYHIYADFPANNEVTTTCYVGDQAGTSWSDLRSPNYAGHFPQFALRKTDTLYTREFSLIVYNDTYTEPNIDVSRAQLAAGKVMGLSLACCENDDPDENPKERDNFFGSVWVPAEAYNDHWMNADDFGVIKLIGNPGTGVDKPAETPRDFSLALYPNPARNFIRLNLETARLGDVRLRLYNMIGQEVFQLTQVKSERVLNELIPAETLDNGVYFLVIELPGARMTKKITVVR